MKSVSKAKATCKFSLDGTSPEFHFPRLRESADGKASKWYTVMPSWRLTI